MGRRRKSLRWQQNIQLKKYSQEISLWKRFCDFLRMSNQNCILRNTTGRRHTSTWWPPSKRQNYDLNILYLIYVVHHIKKSQISFIFDMKFIRAQWSAVVLYPDDVLQLQAKKHRPESAMDVPVHIMNWVGLGASDGIYENIWKMFNKVVLYPTDQKNTQQCLLTENKKKRSQLANKCRLFCL